MINKIEVVLMNKFERNKLILDGVRDIAIIAMLAVWIYIALGTN